ncbi:unnamed protein product [Lactuca saligna]|uniref:Uncharacterized protein n=1 Tax=Lactuca saligna TaxID=75948 RepID=A0AA36A0M8_LACSI|nr:unnamed protein product [Lactuca saligna]
MKFMALGKSGDAILKHVLIDLVDGIDTSADRTKKRSLTRGAIWWRIAYAFGAIASILWVAPDAFGGVQPTWRTTFLICLISMIAALIIFCTGHKVYHQHELTQRPVEIFFRVFRAKVQKLLKSKSRCSMNSLEQEKLPETRRQENEGIALDRSPPHLDTNGKKYRGNSSYKEDIKVVRSLLRMFPMWGTLIVVSLVSAAGSTFYIEQFSNLKGNEEIPAQMFDVIQDTSGFAILIMYSWTPFYKNEKLKIGVGMFCSVISCVCAWRLEVSRLKAVTKQGDDDDDTSISFLWLVPQFSILGCMECLAEEGSLNFFKSQIEEPIKSYREEYMEVVICFGILVNTFLILILKTQGWFGYDVNNGTRLDKYYRLLVYLCSANFIVYYCIAKCFYKETEQERHSAQGNLQLSQSADHATTGNSYRRKRFLVLLSRQVSFVFDTLF